MRQEDQARYRREYEELNNGFTEATMGGFVDERSVDYQRQARMDAQRRAEDRQRRYQLYLQAQAKERKRTRVRRILLAVIAVLLLAAAAGFVVWRSWARKPATVTKKPELTNAMGGNVARGDEIPMWHGSPRRRSLPCD